MIEIKKPLNAPTGSLASVVETKAEEAVVKGRKALRDVKREFQELGDKVKDKVDQAGLKIKEVKKKIY